MIVGAMIAALFDHAVGAAHVNAAVANAQTHVNLRLLADPEGSFSSTVSKVFNRGPAKVL